MVFANNRLPRRILDSFQEFVSTGPPIKQILQISASCQTLHRSKWKPGSFEQSVNTRLLIYSTKHLIHQTVAQGVLSVRNLINTFFFFSFVSAVVYTPLDVFFFNEWI